MEKILYRSISFNKQIVLLLVVLFASTRLFSQEVNYKEPPQVFNNGEIHNSRVNSQFLPDMLDSQIVEPNHISLNPKTYIKLNAKSDMGSFRWAITHIRFEVYYFLANGTLDMSSPDYLDLIVEYNPLNNSNQFKDVAEHVVTNRYGIRVKVLDVDTTFPTDGSHTTDVEENIVVELGFECERYFQLTEQLTSMSYSINTETNEIGVNSAVNLRLGWDQLAGATDYELEWTWVDNFDNPLSDGSISTLTANHVLFSNKDFEKNCTRIKTKNTYFEIPLIYSHGFIIYRVRGVGRFLDEPSKLLFGEWSSGNTNKINVEDWANHFVEVEDHERQKNWQFQSSYGEEGKKKEVVSYFDGSLRNRQTVTKNNSDDNAIAGEVVYDNQGRPAIDILPVPLFKKNYLRYFNFLNKNTHDNGYTHNDFDWDTLKEICNTAVSGMSTETGASNYYSMHNEFGGPNIDYVPDALEYPFSQVEYTADNTGRVKRKGGVGPTHQLGGGHEMRYFYTTPFQEELDRLFGYSVGFASHYKKNIVIDPNGQVSVSYIDPMGRTVATSFVGESPKALIALDEVKNGNHTDLRVDLMNNTQPEHLDTPTDNNILGSTGVFSDLNDKLTLAKEIIVAGNNVGYHFEYRIQNENYFSPDKCSTLYPFVYDLRLGLRDECGDEKFNEFIPDGGSLYKKIGDTTNPIPLTQFAYDKVLNTGTYSLIKELKVNEEALNSFADKYIDEIKYEGSGPNCYVSPQVFTSSATDSTCQSDCTSCINEIGTQESFIKNQLIDHYNNSSFTFNLASNIVNFTDSDIDINGTDLINVSEVNLLRDGFKNDWTELKNGCNRLCGPTFASSCSINETMLISDLSPKGQYGNDDLVNVNTDPDGAEDFQITNTMSIFNSVGTSQLYYNGSSTHIDWRTPLTPYKDENGEESFVQVELNADTTTVTDDYLPEVFDNSQIITETISGIEVKKVRPQNLKKVTDFINTFWLPSWVNSLLPYHPEYCYLNYSKQLCTRTKNTKILKTPTSSATDVEYRDLSTDEYDDYLQYLTTFQGAVNSDFASATTGISAISLFDNDPYFQNNFTGYEDTNLYNWRRSIMTEAINTEYENHGKTMLTEAYGIVMCNAITPCPTTFSFSSLTPEQKNKLWNTYKNLYISLKSKVKYVFLNVYAKQNGCYNGCIGNDSPTTITNVIKYYNNAGNILGVFNGVSSTIPQLCSATNTNYYTKEKRFIRADFGYDSGVSESAALSQITAQNDYQYYAQTGACPLLSDLELYLDGYFQSATSNFPTSGQAVQQYLTQDLMNGFASNTVLSFPITPTAPTLSTQVSNGNKTLTFQYSVLTSTNQLVLTLPSSGIASGIDWTNYLTTWTIVDFKQLYYNALQSSLTDTANLTFAFSAVAVVIIGGQTKEIVVTGTTRAAVGECGLVNDGIGQVLDNNTATSDSMQGCSKKYKFKEAFLRFLNQLRTGGNLFSSSVSLATKSTVPSGLKK